MRGVAGVKSTARLQRILYCELFFKWYWLYVREVLHFFTLEALTTRALSFAEMYWRRSKQSTEVG